MLEFFLESYYLFVDINLWNGDTVKIFPRFLFLFVRYFKVGFISDEICKAI